MTNLTEQYRKGELPDGYYYVKIGTDFVVIDCYADTWDYLVDEQIEEVISEVPSYQEYLEMEGHCGAYSTANQVLKDENARLKKWCEEFNALDVATENTSLRMIRDELDCKVCNLQEKNIELKELLSEIHKRFVEITTDKALNLSDCDLIRRISNVI